MQSISVEAWTDDSDMNTNDDWQTFSDSYPIAATWLQDCEASRNGEQRVVTRTIRNTRTRHLGFITDTGEHLRGFAAPVRYFKTVCGMSGSTRDEPPGRYMNADTGYDPNNPWRICPKCKAIAKAANAKASGRA